VEIAHRHMGRRATMKDSIEAAAYHAWVTLRGNRFDAIRQGHDHHLPRADKDLEDGWGMLEPLGLDSTARGAVYFAYDMVKKSQNLEDTVRQQGRDLKRLQKENGDLRERLGEPRIYDLLPSPLRVAQTRQKSYADNRRRELVFKEGDYVYLKVSPMSSVKRFNMKGKLAPRYVGPFKILKRRGEVAYQLELPDSLLGVHDVFHVS